MAYIIILPDPDWRHRCRHRGGDPDCACYPECPECGALYTPSEGHDCIDSELSKCDLLDIARELRDKLDAYETERDKAVKSLQKAGYTDCGGELWKPPIGPSASPLLEEIDRLRAQIAALQAVPQGVELTEDDVRRALMSNAIDVDVEGVTPRLNRIIVSRLVPTTIKPLQPEERRMGPDEVAVSREEWEALNAFLEDWRDPESRSLHDWNTSLKAKAARINALRTSAQDHNGEGAKYKGPSGTTDGGGCMADAFC